MTVEQFIEGELKVVRERFAKELDAKRWGWVMGGPAGLKAAILLPGKMMRQMGIALDLERQRVILRTVWQAVAEHGNWSEVHNLGLYLFTAVQRHMEIHRARYYEQAKAERDRTIFKTEAERLAHGARQKAATEAAAILEQVAAAMRAGRQQRHGKRGAKAVQGGCTGELELGL